MKIDDTWLWFLVWPLVTGSLVVAGALGPGPHPWLGWGAAFTGGVGVLAAIGMGVLLGLRLRQSLTESLTRWATGAQALYDQEALHHERTADVLFDLASGLIGATEAQQYLAELDNPDATDEDDEDESPEEPH